MTIDKSPFVMRRKPKSTKPACSKGHAFTEENTYVSPKGCQMCRTCMRKQVRAFRRKVFGYRHVTKNGKGN